MRGASRWRISVSAWQRRVWRKINIDRQPAYGSNGSGARRGAAKAWRQQSGAGKINSDGALISMAATWCISSGGTSKENILFGAHKRQAESGRRHGGGGGASAKRRRQLPSAQAASWRKYRRQRHQRENISSMAAHGASYRRIIEKRKRKPAISENGERKSAAAAAATGGGAAGAAAAQKAAAASTEIENAKAYGGRRRNDGIIASIIAWRLARYMRRAWHHQRENNRYQQQHGVAAKPAQTHARRASRRAYASRAPRARFASSFACVMLPSHRRRVAAHISNQQRQPCSVNVNAQRGSRWNFGGAPAARKKVALSRRGAPGIFAQAAAANQRRRLLALISRRATGRSGGTRCIVLPANISVTPPPAPVWRQPARPAERDISQATSSAPRERSCHGASNATLRTAMA
jgi:hypothetical protein